MNKGLLYYILFFLFPLLGRFEAYSQEPLWKLALINKADSVAEEYIQNSAWCFYRSNLYTQAVNASEIVLSLREKLYGKGSAKYLEWLRVMSYQAYNHNQIDDVIKYCDKEITIVKEHYGLQSRFYEEAISSIQGYANQLVDVMPDFITNCRRTIFYLSISTNLKFSN